MEKNYDNHNINYKSNVNEIKGFKPEDRVSDLIDKIRDLDDHERDIFVDRFIELMEENKRIVISEFLEGFIAGLIHGANDATPEQISEAFHMIDKASHGIALSIDSFKAAMKEDPTLTERDYIEAILVEMQDLFEDFDDQEGGDGDEQG